MVLCEQKRHIESSDVHQQACVVISHVLLCIRMLYTEEYVDNASRTLKNFHGTGRLPI